VVQVALALLKGGGVAEGALVVGNGPLWGAHNSEVVVDSGYPYDTLCSMMFQQIT
jgi:hypothetical protein